METIKNIIGGLTTSYDPNQNDAATQTVITVESTESSVKELETTIEALASPNINTKDAWEVEMDKREQQDQMWALANNRDMTREELNRAYTSILTSNNQNTSNSLKSQMLYVVHTRTPIQGEWANVPIDFHKGPFLNAEDEYTIIFQADNESKIRGNCNSDLIKTIGDTEITYGMKAYAEGVKWNNGLICYNSSNIVVREADNNFGQPGFLSGFYFADRLAIEIVERYVIPELVRKANRNEFTIMTNPTDVKNTIRNRYNEVRQTMLKRLENSDMTETELFADAPIKEELNSPMTDSDLRVAELEQRVRVLEDRVEFLVKRLEEVEDIALDSAITRTERAIDGDDQ